MYENESCSTCTHAKHPGYLFCSKHGCRVDENDCCQDYGSPVGALARIILEEDGVIPRSQDSGSTKSQSNDDTGWLWTAIDVAFVLCCIVGIIKLLLALL